MAKLHQYTQKRNFKKTREPIDDPKLVEKLHRQYGSPLFVIQQHDASSMHFDLRLEIDGVMKSWAVPKGPSTDPREKRLAVETEDHPIAYASFEGVIPEGEYGAGTVIVWDIGSFKNAKEMPLSKQYRDGQIEFLLQGEKLQGRYALVNSKMQGKKENWILVKMKDDHADARRNPTNTEPRSVLSDKTVKELAKEFAKERNDS